MSAIRCILMDIEGTTTDIAFVHRVLFPYARQRLADYVATHADDSAVRDCLAQVVDTVRRETGQAILETDAVNVLLAWTDADRKHGALKTLQGLIWEAGFQNGDFKGHVYPDVPPAFDAWRAAGYRLAIYSSGSVQAQKLLFGYSEAGDLTPSLEAYFDTAVGGKKERASYEAIARALNLAPGEILFLSDVGDELAAARDAGLQVLQSRRPGIESDERFEGVSDFTAVCRRLEADQVVNRV